MSKKSEKQAAEIARLKAEKNNIALRLSSIESAAEERAAAAQVAAAAPPPAPAPVDPALADYKRLKGSADPHDKLVAGAILVAHPHVMGLLEAERKG